MYEEMKAEIDVLVCIGNLGLGMAYRVRCRPKRDGSMLIHVIIEKEDDKENIWYQVRFEINKQRKIVEAIYYAHDWDGDIYEKVDFLKPIKEMKKRIFSHEG